MCKIAKFCTIENIVAYEKGVKISIPSRGDTSCVPVLITRLTFAHTLKFWSPLQYSHYHEDLLLPHLKAMGSLP